MDHAQLQTQIAVATLSIGGMTCSSCSNGIQQGLEKLPIVQSSNISVLTHSGQVVYDKSHPTALAEIVELIEDQGYECAVRSVEPFGREKQEESTNSRTIQLKIDGMFCEICPSKITNSLSDHFGERIEVIKPLGMKEGILSIRYIPGPPYLSIRSIIAYLKGIDSSFKVQPYHALSAEAESARIQTREQRAVLWRLVLAAIIAIPTLFIGVVWMSLVPENDSIRMWFEQPFFTGHATRSQWALFILATPTYFISASNFHIKAGKEIFSLWRRRSRVPILKRLYRFGSMNLLISAGTTVAYIASIALLGINATSKTTKNTSTYFDTVVFLTFFILIGKYLEAVSKAKAGDAVSMLGQLRPEKATLVVPLEELSDNAPTDISRQASQAPKQIRVIPSDLLEVGDTVIVPHGSTPPADGALLSREGQFDESSLTGESKAVHKSNNDKVFLGTINTGNPVKVIVTDIGSTSMLDQIITVVREGQTKRAPVERIAGIVTAYFVPVITLLAILTFFIWLALGTGGHLNPRYLANSSGGWAFWSLEFAIAVFVVACPCGIGLAAPTALYVGSGLAAKAGILVRGGGEAFQDASQLDAVVFDKTGTLTEGGDVQLTDYVTLPTVHGVPCAVLWSMARAMEEVSSHPIAKAIASAALTHRRADIETVEITEIPGKGMKGTFTIDLGEKRTFEAILGSETLLDSIDPKLLDNQMAVGLLAKWKSECKSVAAVAIRDITGKLPATPWILTDLFSLSDPIRPSAAATISALQARGIEIYMLSGDNAETARAVAAAIGIPVANVFAGALPTDKANRIEELKKDLSQPLMWFGKETIERIPGRVAFVGDGINDAPALMASTVSISLSSGSPIALTSSSFILLTPSLESIVTLLTLSKKVFRRIKWNFGWALVYNIVLIPVAAGVFFKTSEDGFILGPVWASAAMAMSSLTVILASLAMRWGW